ncbi:hypothetical protein BDB00DRAFT_790624 [Zychaea mexicana]|uniref:uncharacterized protein n=1 Tax=Zychaea mexicana TaxID=64656 RepID=UPI0022FE9380|nr:uncharacterized protein BDB00DRAFT_790624 [Zychaea mexicana]KAI9490006.1 hypothetical protein BDB00DRAFT_790624 [Zychaea mexicana]
MADAYPYQPIIRLPKSKTSSTSTRSNRQDSITLGSSNNAMNGVADPKDTIVSDMLYFDGLDGAITESDICSLLQDCQPTEIVIHTDRGSGHLRFSDPKMADRVYSLYNGFTFPNNNSKLQFRISHDGSFEHEAKCSILHVKNLPLKIDNNALYDLFRPFGPLSLCKPIVEGRTFRGTAFVQYFFQTDSDQAQMHMHGKMLDGNALNVGSFMPSKTRPATATATAAAAAGTDQTNKNSSTTLPHTAAPFHTAAGGLSPNHNNCNNSNSSAVSTPNTASGANDKSDSGYVDYMNLYIKNLDANVSNNDLFNLFRKFGRIISARVMSNPQTGQSKGYGFVSYDKPEEASAALREMNGKLIGTKQLIVAYHEPKKPRQEKQQQQSSSSNNNNNTSTTNTTPNTNNNNNNNSNSSPVTNNNAMQPFMGAIGTPVRSPPHASTDYNSNNNNNHNNNHASSSSAAAAAAAAVAAVSATNPATGMGGTPYSSHDTRHPYDMSMPSVPINMPSQVNGLGIDNVDQIAMTMKSVGQKRPSPPHPMHRKFSAAESNFGQHPLRPSPPFSTSPMSGVSSTGPSLASLASGLNVQPRPNNLPPHQQQPHQQQQPPHPHPHHHQHHPQQQQQQQQHHQPHHHQSPQPLPLQQHQQAHHQDYRNNGGRPTLRRKGSLESVSSVMTESSASMQRQRLMEAVMRCGDYGKALSDIVDMLLTLKRKERSLCLFNQDFLKDKIQLALVALDTATTIAGGTGGHSPMAPVSPLVRQQQQAPQRVSKAIPIVAPKPEPVAANAAAVVAKSPSPPTTANTTPNTAATTTTTTTTTMTHTTATTPIAAAASKKNTNGTAPPSSSRKNNNKNSSNQEVQEIEQLLSALEGKPTHEKKQQLGDRLFPRVKATGTKQAPKVTIRLLDTIELHELAHLMLDKDQLKERVDVAFASLK